MVICTESHYCAKSPSFPTCNEWHDAKLGQNKTRIYTQTIPRNLVFTRLQSIDGWKDWTERSYGELKWVTNPSENLKWIDYHVCNIYLSENWT